jgi:hypothetical protein
MPNWKKVIVSGSDASLNSLFVTTSVTGSVFSGSFTGSLQGTASFAQNSLTASFVTSSNVFGPHGSNSVLSASHAVSASYAPSAGGISGGSTNYITIWNSSTTLSSSAMFQSASNIGVGTLNPFQRLTVLGTLELGSTQSPQGGAFLYRNYLGASNNYINVVGSEFSSGAMTLGYGATGKAGASGYTSTLDIISTHRSILNIGAGRLQFLQSRQAVNTPVGNDVPMTSSFSIEQNGLASFSDGVNVSGSLNVSSSITASNALITNTLTVQTIIAQVITSSTDFVTGSTRFGTLLTNTHQFTGSVSITGSLTVNGPLNATASWAQNALTASFVTSSNVFGPLGSNSILSSSYSVTSSFTISSSYSLSSSLAQTASFITASSVFGPFGSNSVLSSSFASSSREIEGGANRYITMWSGSTRLTSSVFYQDASNNIGLGTLTPQARLHVYRDTDPSLIVGQSGSIAKQTLLTHYTSGNGYFYIQSVFQGTAYTPIILNEQGGNVGVGLLSPTAKLHVSGTTGGIFEVDGANAVNALYINSSGNVGLGTVSPVHKLDISGSARITSSIFLPGLTIVPQTNIVTINTTTGQLYYTASSAIGGGLSGGTNNYIPLWTGTNTLSSSLLVQNVPLNTVTAYGSIYAYTEQTGSGLNLIRSQNRDTTAGITHESRFGTQQLGAGAARTLLYTASPNTSDTWGELIILSENGGALLASIGKVPSGITNNVFSLYTSGSGNIETIRLHSAGNSFLNGGNVGIGDTSPTVLVDAYKATGGIIRIRSGDGGAFYVSDSSKTTTIAAFGDSAGIIGGTANATASVYAGAVPLIFYVNSAERARIATTGDITFGSSGLYYDSTNKRLGIGVGSPSQVLDVAAAFAIAKFTSTTGTNSAFFQYINTGGNFYLGLEGSAGGTFGASAYAGVVYHSGAYPIQFFTNATLKATLTSGGNLGIGANTSTTTYKLDVNANGATGARVFSGSLAVGNILPSATVGRIDASNDVVAFSTSDMRFKTNITPISGALDKVTQIGGYEFDWVPNEEYHGFKGHDVGVIAQEIEKVLPEVVKERDSGYKAVKYEKIVPLLIEAIKEQQQQIDELRYLLQNKT